MNLKERMKYVWQCEADAVRGLCDEIDFDAASALIGTLMQIKQNGKRIFFAGVGTSAAAAKKAAHSFSCIEFPSSFLSPGDAVHGGLGVVQAGDMVVLISKGGNTEEIVGMIDSLKKKGAFVTGVTENQASKLGKNADLLLCIKIEREPDSFNMLATASTMAVVAFFDAAAICLMEKSGYTREQFTLIHPGGAVGERLTQHRQ